MSKLWSPQMTDLALAGAATILLPVAVFVAWPLVARRMAPMPRGTVLIYEVDPETLAGDVKAEMPQLLGAIDRRLNAGSQTLARVQTLDDRRIEVAVIRPEEGDTRRVEKLLTRSATLEFRILANDRHDKALVDRALADPSQTRLLDPHGKLLAWWVPVRAGQEDCLRGYSDIACRTKKPEKRQITEVLVVKDAFDLTGAYLVQAEAGSDYRGQPTLDSHVQHQGRPPVPRIDRQPPARQSGRSELQARHRSERRVALRALDREHDPQLCHDHRLLQQARSPRRGEHAQLRRPAGTGPAGGEESPAVMQLVREAYRPYWPPPGGYRRCSSDLAFSRSALALSSLPKAFQSFARLGRHCQNGVPSRWLCSYPPSLCRLPWFESGQVRENSSRWDLRTQLDHLIEVLESPS